MAMASNCGDRPATAIFPPSVPLSRRHSRLEEMAGGVGGRSGRDDLHDPWPRAAYYDDRQLGAALVGGEAASLNTLRNKRSYIGPGELLWFQSTICELWRAPDGLRMWRAPDAATS
ncbi:hypothetical protein EJB05_26274, partial [Eragrostis curvula]